MKVTAKAVDGSEHEVDVDEMTWRPSVYGIVIHDGKILLSPQHGLGYDLPGGGMEMHETFMQTVIREVKEETGIDVKPISIVGCQDSFFVWKPEDLEQKNVQHSIQVYVRCEVIGGALCVLTLFIVKAVRTQFATNDLDQVDSMAVANSVDFREHIQKAVEELA